MKYQPEGKSVGVWKYMILLPASLRPIEKKTEISYAPFFVEAT
jgi:hypothetical protein